MMVMDKGGDTKELECELNLGHLSQHRSGEVEW